MERLQRLNKDNRVSRREEKENSNFKVSKKYIYGLSKKTFEDFLHKKKSEVKFKLAMDSSPQTEKKECLPADQPPLQSINTEEWKQVGIRPKNDL